MDAQRRHSGTERQGVALEPGGHGLPELVLPDAVASMSAGEEGKPLYGNEQLLGK